MRWAIHGNIIQAGRRHHVAFSQSWVMRWKFRRWVELQTDRNGFWNHPIFSTFAWWRSPDPLGILTATMNPMKHWQWTALWTDIRTSINQRKKVMSTWTSELPIGSMYGIYANIGGILMANVTLYSIHGSYGLGYIRIYQDIHRQLLFVTSLTRYIMPLFLWHLHALTVDVAARSNLGDRCRHQKKHIVTTVDVFAPALQGSPVLVEASSFNGVWWTFLWLYFWLMEFSLLEFSLSKLPIAIIVT